MILMFLYICGLKFFNWVVFCNMLYKNGFLGVDKYGELVFVIILCIFI